MTKTCLDGVSNYSAIAGVELPIVPGSLRGELDRISHSGYILARFDVEVNSQIEVGFPAPSGMCSPPPTFGARRSVYQENPDSTSLIKPIESEFDYAS